MWRTELSRLLFIKIDRLAMAGLTFLYILGLCLGAVLNYITRKYGTPH